MSGLAEVIASLDAAVERVSLAAPQATRAVGEEVVEVAKSLAPVRSGTLRDSIEILDEERDVEGCSVTVGTTIVYAEDVEHGTSDTPAQPFLRPAIEQGRASMMKSSAAVLRPALQE